MVVVDEEPVHDDGVVAWIDFLGVGAVVNLDDGDEVKWVNDRLDS